MTRCETFLPASLIWDCVVGNDRNGILMARAGVSRYVSLLVLHINLAQLIRTLD